jgi:competence protein ComEA
VAGEAPHTRVHDTPTRRHRATPPPDSSVDVNAADAAELAAVPGIGRAVAARIVELREREGSFASLDELLDVAGMTQSRLERARSYLRDP